MRNFVTVSFTKYCLGDQIKEHVIGRECGMHGRNEKCIQYFGWKT
jgi:hypothetical protein